MSFKSIIPFGLQVLLRHHLKVGIDGHPHDVMAAGYQLLADTYGISLKSAVEPEDNKYIQASSAPRGGRVPLMETLLLNGLSLRELIDLSQEQFASEYKCLVVAEMTADSSVLLAIYIHHQLDRLYLNHDVKLVDSEKLSEELQRLFAWSKRLLKYHATLIKTYTDSDGKNVTLSPFEKILLCRFAGLLDGMSEMVVSYKIALKDFMPESRRDSQISPLQAEVQALCEHYFLEKYLNQHLVELQSVKLKAMYPLPSRTPIIGMLLWAFARSFEPSFAGDTSSSKRSQGEQQFLRLFFSKLNNLIRENALPLEGLPEKVLMMVEAELEIPHCSRNPLTPLSHTSPKRAKEPHESALREALRGLAEALRGVSLKTEQVVKIGNR